MQFPKQPAYDHIAFDNRIKTPAYLYDLDRVRQSAAKIREITDRAGAHLLYSLKASSAPGVISTISQYVGGYSCSSLSEIENATRWGSKDAELHWINPLIADRESHDVFQRCHSITLNSLGQYERWKHEIQRHGNVGLRVNPGISFANERRYDPCARGSRLGVWASTIGRDDIESRNALNALEGLHFHTNCDAEDSEALSIAAHEVVAVLSPFCPSVKWVNIGGGYLPTKWNSDTGLRSAVNALRNAWSCEVYFEPGADFVRDAGYLISTVGDIVRTPTGKVAVLDTSVNHWPEVFEYQFWPDAIGDTESGSNAYTLAGRSCLPGDIFGEYAFDSPLNVGDRVVFSGAGAYSLVKAHQFNGLPLPNRYHIDNGYLFEETRQSFELLINTGGGAINENS